ncbi:MAG: polyphenol oxidase family protein [Spirochaetes bacterium]|nr:polyphenol oxidase family protein [Spirochaetota bacterium]MBX3721477.1 polyphenol oxidase family protein [Turneriella sp.]
MIIVKRGIASGSVSSLFIGKDAAFAAEGFTSQYQEILGKFPELRGLAYSEQVHGDRSFEIGETTEKLFFAGEGDALFTRISRQALIIRTADCIPILFYSPSQPLIGAVHAGWRGLKAKILTKTLAAAGLGDDLEFIVGPCIGGKSYEVGSDVSSQFASAFSISKVQGKFLLDLRQVLESEFAELGVTPERIEWHDEDTLRTPEWYSARRGDTRRNLAVIFRV